MKKWRVAFNHEGEDVYHVEAETDKEAFDLVRYGNNGPVHNRVHTIDYSWSGAKIEELTEENEYDETDEDIYEIDLPVSGRLIVSTQMGTVIIDHLSDYVNCYSYGFDKKIDRSQDIRLLPKE